MLQLVFLYLCVLNCAYLGLCSFPLFLLVEDDWEMYARK